MRQPRNEDGMALVLALGILLVLTILGTVIATYTTAGQRTASRSSAGVSAYSLAEAGINNAMSVLAKPKSALDATLASAATTKLTTAAGHMGGTFNAATSTWAITSTGYMRNPTGGSRPVTRKISVTVKVRPSLMQPTSNPAWNYIIATRTSTPKGCDQSLNNSVNIQSPMYVLGNLCLNTPSQITGGPLHVHGSMTLDVNTNVGSSGAPLNEVHVRNGCSYKTSAYFSPCTPTQKVWASVVDANPITLDLPTADYPSWYVNSAPGPRQACTTQSGTVPVFDNDTTWDNSVGSVFNLTPSSSDYSCIVRSGSTVVGQLSWDHTAKTLTILGTVFIDGSVTVELRLPERPDHVHRDGHDLRRRDVPDQEHAALRHDHRGERRLRLPHWDPNSRFLVIVANGNGGQVPVGDSIQLVSSSFEGGLFGDERDRARHALADRGPDVQRHRHHGQHRLREYVAAHQCPGRHAGDDHRRRAS